MKEVVCLACGLGGENGPLRKREVYCHGGKCKSVVDDGINGLQAYISDARGEWAGNAGENVSEETGTDGGVPAGFIPVQVDRGSK